MSVAQSFNALAQSLNTRKRPGMGLAKGGESELISVSVLSFDGNMQERKIFEGLALLEARL